MEDVIKTPSTPPTKEHVVTVGIKYSKKETE